jgi:cephalosporin hydroxylase
MIDRNFVINLAHRNTDINEYLMSLYNMAIQINAQTIVELGAGQSTFALTAAAIKTGGEFYSIDLSINSRERLYDEGSGAMLDTEPKYHFIQGDDREIAKTWKKEIDFLLHDTDHLYESTLAELRLWTSFIKKRGIYVMHDTGHEAGDGMGCRKALNEWHEQNKERWIVVHLLDTKILGMSVLIKI